MSNWRNHTQDIQPDKTKGKMVIYKCVGSDIIHLPYLANEINWQTKSAKKPIIGMIEKYKIVDRMP